jgi:hypothetical protein
MAYRRYSSAARDPFRMVSRYAGKCAKCGADFNAGELIFYYPNGKKAYSGACARQAEADFVSAAGDEAAYNGTGSIAY